MSMLAPAHRLVVGVGGVTLDGVGTHQLGELRRPETAITCSGAVARQR